MSEAHPLVAIVDDDAGVCRALQRLVRSAGYRASAYPTGEALLEMFEADPPDHVLLDLHLPGLSGAALIARLRVHREDLAITVMTGLDTPGARDACLLAGASGYFVKPVLLRDLIEALAAT